MQVLVTGGLGYIGSHTSVLLLEKGYDLVIVDDLSNSNEKVIENIKYLNEANIKYGKHAALLPQFIVFDHNYEEVKKFKEYCS